MAIEPLIDLQKFLQERRALLWVCQRYDLNSGENPHDYDLPETEAATRYRKQPTMADETLSKLYWEAIWLEGARSPLLSSLRKREQQDLPATRKMVILASEADANANLNSAEFIPVFSLPGLIYEQPGLTPGSQYDSSRKRSRERIAWDLSSRLMEFPHRLLVVIGAEGEDDLKRLFEVLSERPILDLTVLIILPEGSAEPQQPENISVRITIWRGTVDALTKLLLEMNAPESGELPEWTIRIGKRVVKLSERDVSRIREHFAILTEKQLIRPDRLTIDDLHAFFAGNLENWKAYAENVGLPVERDYRTELNETLFEVVLSALKNAASTDLANFFHVRVPCETASGATTLLRHVAFRAAYEGFPTLIFRQDRMALDLEEVVGFATSLVENCLDQGINQSPVLLMVLDVEHEPLTNVGKIGQTLAASGRNVVILQAINSQYSSGQEISGRNGRLLSVLKADATTEEIARCHKVLTDIVTRWSLDLNIPDQPAWDSFIASTKFIETTVEDEDKGSKFWVALWFFLTLEMDFLTGERFREALGRWIEKRCLQITSEPIKKLLSYVAVLSSFRLASPLWTVLRPATGGVFTSELSPALKQFDGVIEWGPLQKSHQDHTLRFVHPTIAVEFLRRKGIRDYKSRLVVLQPVLDGLSPGHAADIWLAETIATEVLAPKYEERLSSGWDWRIATFVHIPSPLSNQSKTILHHWARCLYLSADERHARDITTEERLKLIRESVKLLQKALNLPQRFGRDEHPSHLYNTLATAYSRLASLLETLPQQGDHVKEAWEQCYKNFEESIRLSGHTNVEALLAFARRRMDRWEHASDVLQKTDLIDHVAEALSLLDEAEEIMTNLPSPELLWEIDLNNTRTRTLNALNSTYALEFVENLKSSSKAELGYFCHAQMLLRGGQVNSIEKAIQILLEARETDIKLGHRSLHLLLLLLKRHPQHQFDFDLLRQLYLELEASPEYSIRPIDLFWHAVTCYQIGEYQEGAQRFARLREQSRQLDNYRLRIREVWRDKKNPSLPRETIARVSRIINEFRAEGFVEEIGQKVFLRPRHWTPMPKLNDPVRCVIRFESNGPLAVPTRFEKDGINLVTT